MKGSSLVVAVVASVLAVASGFPDGAPADTCVKTRFNQPNHGAARSQELSSSPFRLMASGNTFAPGGQIQVDVSGQDVFRGFFLQARDAQTNEWIGEWVESPNTKTIPECSAITHADNKDKERATFIWTAPKDRQGQVYIT